MGQWGGAQPNAGRKKGGKNKPKGFPPQIFDDETEAQCVAALVEIAKDKKHAQCVAANKLLLEYKHGKPAQMVVNANEQQFTEHLLALRRAVEGRALNEKGAK